MRLNAVLATARIALTMVSAPLAAQAATDDVRTAGWLAGCWELRGGARVTTEMWMAPAGGLMLGASRTVVRDTTREFESLRLSMRDGKLTYTAIPSRQTETSFPAILVSDTALVFENLAHDFPQRIIYRRVGADTVVARIEGPRGGQTRGVDFPMRRVSCGG
jgi:hypothetical protein